jgi:hypothetical protein
MEVGGFLGAGLISTLLIGYFMLIKNLPQVLYPIWAFSSLARNGLV